MYTLQSLIINFFIIVIIKQMNNSLSNKNDIFTQIDDRKRVKQFHVSGADKALTEIKNKNNDLVKETISYYQTASERYKNGKMKER